MNLACFRSCHWIKHLDKLPAKDSVISTYKDLHYLFSLQEHLLELEREQDIEGQILYALFEDSTNKTWRVATVPAHPDSFELRKSIKSEWKALRDGALDSKSGIEGCIFVHASGFIGGHKNREGALQMAIQSLED